MKDLHEEVWQMNRLFKGITLSPPSDGTNCVHQECSQGNVPNDGGIGNNILTLNCNTFLAIGSDKTREMNIGNLHFTTKQTPLPKIRTGAEGVWNRGL